MYGIYNAWFKNIIFQELFTFYYSYYDLIILGISFLQQCTPEFILVYRVHEGQLAVVGGQTVVHHHLHPLALPPKMEAEHPTVAILKTLVRRNHLRKQSLIHG